MNKNSRVIMTAPFTMECYVSNCISSSKTACLLGVYPPKTKKKRWKHDLRFFRLRLGSFRLRVSRVSQSVVLSSKWTRTTQYSNRRTRNCPTCMAQASSTYRILLFFHLITLRIIFFILLVTTTLQYAAVTTIENNCITKKGPLQ